MPFVLLSQQSHVVLITHYVESSCLKASLYMVRKVTVLHPSLIAPVLHFLHFHYSLCVTCCVQCCIMHVRLIGCSVSAGSFTTEYGSGPRQAFTTREDAQLLKTVLQDSINLLEQVGGRLIPARIRPWLQMCCIARCWFCSHYELRAIVIYHDSLWAKLRPAKQPRRVFYIELQVVC